MKCFSIMAAILIFSAVAFSQVEFVEHNIDDNFRGASDVCAADLDRDGDMDVLGAARYISSVFWWENDGEQDFAAHVISDSIRDPRDVHVCDLDGDGDRDVLGTSTPDDAIYWWENDGEQNFTERFIADDFNGAYSVIACDLDEDDDMDILGSSGTDGISWWENDGDQDFEEHSVDDEYDSANSVWAVDMDDDGDLDILGGSDGDQGASWWENDGELDFTRHVINDWRFSTKAAYPVDLNRDGNMDLLDAMSGGRCLRWWRNDGRHNFSSHFIFEEHGYCYDVVAADLDHDADIDIVGGLFWANNVVWWENDGDQNFELHRIAEQFLDVESVDVADVDGDGDIDILGAARSSHSITWWENMTPQPEFTVEPDSLDFGFVTLNDRQTAELSIIYRFDIDDPEDIQLIFMIGGQGWLAVDPQMATFEVNDTLDVEVTVAAPDGIDPGAYEGVIHIIPLGYEWQTIDVPVGVFFVEGFASMTGVVTDAATNRPLHEARVWLTGIPLETDTDQGGGYAFDDLPAWRYRVCAEKDTYLPYSSDEFVVAPDEDIRHDIGMLHALCLPEYDSIDVNIDPGQVEEVDFFISNPGNGQLEFTAQIRFPMAGNFDPWDRVDTINAAEMSGDDRLQGVEFDGTNFYITGGNNGRGRGLVHVFNREGEHVRSFEQFRDSPWGMRDLAWDGELLWAADDETVYGFTTEGNLVTQFQGPLEINRALTWDQGNGLLWTCDIDTDLIGIDREGNVVERLGIPEELHIYGLGTYYDDPDSAIIYIFSKDGVYESQVSKLNLQNGEWFHVADLETPEELKAGGMCIAGSWNPLAVSCAGILQGRRDVLDQVGIWHLVRRDDWVEVRPEAETIPPESDLMLLLTFITEGYPDGITTVCDLIIDHNGRGDSLVVPITMHVGGEETAKPDVKPSDHPVEFGLEQPYPTPFNSSLRIDFSLESQGHVKLTIYDLSGRRVAVPVEGDISPGSHTCVWDAAGMPAGVYLVKLETQNSQAVRKSLLIK